MSENVLKKFGRYFLLDRIAQGGMAEIYRARLAQVDSGGRIIIVKRVRNTYRSNAEFLAMFNSEIKLTMGFNHPNIVQLFDYGEGQGLPYIAMEYVEGRTVRQFASRYFRGKKHLPVEIAATIIEQAARGLHYAHTYKDHLSGEVLNIVHRDVSPQNILISFDGMIKLIDFGIAKAKTSLDLTRTGIIKGKPSYMAPEQVSGEKLDCRADVFALGIVLWELLTGKKLFASASRSDYSVLKLIEKADKSVKPPSAINPEVPKELDEIVMRSLQKKSENRYQTAGDFQKALQKFINLKFPDLNLSEIPYWMDRLFGHERKEDLNSLRTLNSQAETLIGGGEFNEDDKSEVTSAMFTRPADTEDLKNKIIGSRSHPASSGIYQTAKKAVSLFEGPSFDYPEGVQPRKSIVLNLEKNVVVPLEAPRKVPSRKVSTPSRSPRQRKAIPKRLLTYGIAAALCALLIDPDLLMHFGPMSRLVMEARQQFSALQSGKRYIPILSELVRKGPVMSQQMSSPAEHQKKDSIFMTVRISPSGSKTVIKVNGQIYTGEVPIVRVPLDQKIEVIAERAGFKTLRKEFFLMGVMFKNSEEHIFEGELEPEKFGYLSVSSGLSANVRIVERDLNGNAIETGTWLTKTPVVMKKLPPGLYSIQFTNRSLEVETTERVSIQPGRIARMSLALENESLRAQTENTPEKVPGVVAWFRASIFSGQRNDEAVSGWTDGGRDLHQVVQRNPAQRPLFVNDSFNGQPGLYFNGGKFFSADSLAAEIQKLRAVTLFYVVKGREGLSGTVFACSGNQYSRSWQAQFSADGRPRVQVGQTYIEGRAPASIDAISKVGSKAGIYSFVLKPGQSELYHNGEKKVLGRIENVDFSSVNRCWIGAGVGREPGKLVAPLKGELAELLVYDHALSDDDRKKVETYLRESYLVPNLR